MGILTKKRLHPWRLAIGAAAALTFGAMALQMQPVQAADNVLDQSQDNQRFYYWTDLKGVHGLENGTTHASSFSQKGFDQWKGMSSADKTYTVTAGSHKGEKWQTATLLPEVSLVSSNNPSHKSTTYFAGMPEGFTMDAAGNTYIGFTEHLHDGSGMVYKGYVMKITKAGMDTLKKDPLALRRGAHMLNWKRNSAKDYKWFSGSAGTPYHFKTSENTLNSMLSKKQISFSNIEHDFSSGAFAINPANNTLNYIVAYNTASASHPVTMVTMNTSTLAVEKTTKFLLHNQWTGSYFDPNTLAFDNSGNFYVSAAAQLSHMNQKAYIIYQGRPSGSSWSVRMLDLTMGPLMDGQMQGISISGNRFYITGNSDYYSFDLPAYLAAEASRSDVSAAQASAMNVQVDRIGGSRESENTVENGGRRYMMLTVPSEIIMSGSSASSASKPSTPSKPAAPDSGKIAARGTVTIHYKRGYGIAIWNSYAAGHKVVKSHGKVKTLKSGTRWQYYAKAYYHGTWWYCLGGNQWLQGTYAKP